jgi:hypothetical protein
MADNVVLNAGSGGATAAADEATYSGDTAKIQLVRVVHVSGAEGSKTVSEIVGTAGSPGTGVVTVQGVASGTVIPVSDGGANLSIDDGGGTITVDNSHLTSLGSALRAIDTATGGTDTGILALATRDDALSTLTPADGDNVSLRVTSTGALWVANAGTSSVFVDDAAFTPGTSAVSVIGGQADEASTDSVDEGDAGALRMTLDRKLITTPQPHTGGGLTIVRTLDADETEEEIKATAGSIYGMWATNTGTATAFVKFYNATAANVTVGTTTPVITIGIPGNSSDDVSANFGPGGMGISFDTAITVAAVTEAADNGTTAPGANSVILNVFYK